MKAAAYHWSLDALLSLWTRDDVPTVAVTGVNLDSRMVVSGDVYLAVAGATTHGMRFAEQAVDAGAIAVVLSETAGEQFDITRDKLKQRNIPVIVVDELETHCGAIASRFYGEPDKVMTLVAVTGTDGKTSVCRFITEALTLSGRNCGYIGTLGWGMGRTLNASELTTPDSVTLRRQLATMRDQGARYIALEASSHGIAEGRLDGLSLDVAVLTNLGRDHLDYHGTIEAYKAAKQRLFYWDSLQAVVLNSDDAMGHDLIKQINHLARFSYSSTGKPALGADMYGNESLVDELAATGTATNNNTVHQVLAEHVITDDAGLGFDLVDVSGTRNVSTQLIGRFNVDNLLACYASLLACGVAANDASHCLSKVTPVEGRMERLGGGDKPTVVIDFSHTPNALRVAIDAVRVHCQKHLWVVFGCGGDRDSGKRAPMAKAAQVADHVIVTDDNPRTESSEAIILDVMKGFDEPSRVTVIANRADAIRHALSLAVAGDLVLIAGKGHEDYQIIGHQKYHFSDREQAQLALGVAS